MSTSLGPQSYLDNKKNGKIVAQCLMKFLVDLKPCWQVKWFCAVTKVLRHCSLYKVEQFES